MTTPGQQTTLREFVEMLDYGSGTGIGDGEVLTLVNYLKRTNAKAKGSFKFQLSDEFDSLDDYIKALGKKGVNEVGDELLVNSKATGTLVLDHLLLPGRNLYLIATGTGLAPFMSIIKDPEIYEAFDKVILTHGCRPVDELAYRDLITGDLPRNEYLGETIADKLLYYPTVTREKFRNNGRLTDLLRIGKLPKDLGLPPISVEHDRCMICGSPSMLKDITGMLDSQGFEESRHGVAAHYVIERAFVES
jgi:ferredoxin--NADP+ reductase